VVGGLWLLVGASEAIKFRLLAKPRLTAWIRLFARRRNKPLVEFRHDSLFMNHKKTSGRIVKNKKFLWQSSILLICHFLKLLTA